MTRYLPRTSHEQTGAVTDDEGSLRSRRRDIWLLPDLEERTRGHLCPDLLAETVLLLSETQPGRRTFAIAIVFCRSSDPQFAIGRAVR